MSITHFGEVSVKSDNGKRINVGETITNLGNVIKNHHIDITSPPLPFAPCLMNGSDESSKFNAIVNHFKAVVIPEGTIVANLEIELPENTTETIDIGISIKGVGSKKSVIKAPSDNNTTVAIRGLSKATLTLSNVQVGDKVTINDVEYTAAATTNTANKEFGIGVNDTADAQELVKCLNANLVNSEKNSTRITLVSVVAGDTITINGITYTAAATTNTAKREFGVSGTDAADAYQLAMCINDATYGVSGVKASLNSNVVILKSDAETTITTSTLATTMATSAVINLWSDDTRYPKVDIGTLLPTSIKSGFFRYALINLDLENIKIQGANGNNNNIGLELSYIQNINLDRVRIEDCYGGGMLLNDAMDSTAFKVDIVRCSKANSDDDYSYALQMNAVYDVCNAWKFNACKIEHCPCMVYLNGGNRHNFWDNCKFEKAAENKTTLWNPLKFVNSRENTFNNCFFVNTHGTWGTTLYVADSSLYFLFTSNAKLTTEQQRQRTKLINCNFTTNGYARVQWANVVDCQILNSEFYYTRGTHNISPFYFKGYCDVKNTLIGVGDNSRFIQIGGKHNDIDIKINFAFDADAGTVSSFWLDSSADENSITYSLIGKQMATNYIYAPSFIVDGVMYLLRNTIKEKTNTYITTSESTVVMRSVDVAKVGGNVSLISNISNGQEITLIATASITITAGTYIVTKSGSNVSLTNGQIARFKCIDGICYEI